MEIVLQLIHTTIHPVKEIGSFPNVDKGHVLLSCATSGDWNQPRRVDYVAVVSVYAIQGCQQTLMEAIGSVVLTKVRVRFCTQISTEVSAIGERRTVQLVFHVLTYVCSTVQLLRGRGCASSKKKA